MIGGGVLFPAGGFWVLCDNIAILYEWLSTNLPGVHPYLASLNLAIRRTAWEELGGFDETFVKAEDTELSLRARLAGHELYFEPEAVVSHEPPPSRNRASMLLQRAFESGYWTLHAFLRYEDQIGLSPIYRRAWVTLLLSPLTAGGVVVKIFRRRALQRFWYTVPAVYASKLAWRMGGAYRLIFGASWPPGLAGHADARAGWAGTGRAAR
jgi:GT2 family glycosyltransferase